MNGPISYCFQLMEGIMGHLPMILNPGIQHPVWVFQGSQDGI
jgi:hypothetical protein